MRRRRWLVPALVAGAFVLALAVWALFLRPQPGPQWITAAVVRGDVEKTVVATGQLDPVELVGVGAQASGRVERLHVALGDRVRQGALIAEIDSQPQTNALATARALLANVEAQRAGQLATLARLEADFRRQQTMLPGEATSTADYDAANAALKAARATVASLDAQIAQAKISVANAGVNLGYTQIRAPITGDVLAIVTKQGQTVNANQTTPTIVILGDLKQMTVKAQVSEADVIHLRPGLAVWFTILGDPDHRYRATLRQIEPAPESIASEVATTSSLSSSASSGANTQAIYYNALFDVPNTDGRLRPMMTAEVTILLAAHRGVPTMPATALGQRRADGRYLVRVIDADGRAQERAVTVGLNNNVTAEIRAGLAIGERVVIGEGVAAEPRTQAGPPRRMRPAGM
jgi:macrolide-specific efflux system membrane fusion protein